MDLATVLRNAQHPDTNTRAQAEAYLNQAVEAQYGPFLIALCGELATEGKDTANRQLAGIYIKNMISAEDESLRAPKVDRWMKCDPAAKEQIRQGFLMALQSQVSIVGHTAAQVLAAYGAVDVPMNAWPGLLPALFHNISSPEVHDVAKVSSLEALGYMCDAMKVKIDPLLVNQILSSIIEGMREDRRDEIRLAAVRALNNSLGFTDTNFENADERNVIMNSICTATQSKNVKIRECAYECCATVGEFYYDKIEPYVKTLYEITMIAIRTDEPIVGMQAIEFWNTIADEETKIMEEIDEALKTRDNLLNITQQAAPSLIPVILECMTKQDEDSEDDDSWDISKAGATLLESISKVISDTVVDLVLPFITQHIVSGNWRMKEAAVMAFGMILDGPTDSKLSPIIQQALPILIQCLRDPKPLVRDTTAWTIGKICELHRTSLSNEILQPMIEGLSMALGDSSANVVSQVCFAIFSLAEACEDDSQAATNILSHIMPLLVPKLLAVTTRADLDSDNVRSAAYEAVNKMVENCAVDTHAFIIQLMIESLNRLEQTFAPQVNPTLRMNLQSNLCSLVSEVIRKLSYEEFASYADRTMQLLLQVFSTKGAIAHEDAFLAIGRVADNMHGHFAKYVPFLQPSLMAGLRSIEEYQLCTIAVGVVGDLCRALGKEILPFCDDLMRCLLELLQSSVLNRSVKPHVFGLFSDIALAIEGDFERYCGIILGMLKQAGDVNIETDEEDIIEYINSLRTSLLEAYTGILQGLSAGNKQDLVLPALESMVDFIRRSGTDENRSGEVLKTAVGLLGDLGMIYGNKIAIVYHQPFVATLVKDAMQNGSDAQEIAQWTQERINAVLSGRA